MRTSDFDYELPRECIAQVPVEPRHSSRLIILDRASHLLEHDIFWNLDHWLHAGDLLILNTTRVIPARIYAQKIPGSGKIELLLLRKIHPTVWETLVGGKGMNKGKEFSLGPLTGTIKQVLVGPQRLVEFSEPIDPYLEQIGMMPLPPYIHEKLQDRNRYQTVYANQPGSAAAPTAGLHFTPELISKLNGKGIRFANVDLHVGLDTFAPVKEDDPQEHRIHKEWCECTPETASAVNETSRSGGRIIAVGTTSVRTLESASKVAREGERVGTFAGETDLFILPGYPFKAVDGMITNFHLPRSTLLMLVSAFTGKERILSAYQTAIQEGYRFYSFGDAMLIL
jgi:S-adenosylmethionine:tRNA ribosyltransferase-isomerase